MQMQCRTDYPNSQPIENSKYASIIAIQCSLILDLFHEFHECLLVHQSGIFPVLKYTEISQTQFGEALVNDVYRGMDVKGDRCLYILALR